jgi:hypothetical protein
MAPKASTHSVELILDNLLDVLRRLDNVGEH